MLLLDAANLCHSGRYYFHRKAQNSVYRSSAKIEVRLLLPYVILDVKAADAEADAEIAAAHFRQGNLSEIRNGLLTRKDF